MHDEWQRARKTANEMSKQNIIDAELHLIGYWNSICVVCTVWLLIIANIHTCTHVSC